MSSKPYNGPVLSSTHPLILELTSLRQALADSQKSAHESCTTLLLTENDLSTTKKETDHLRQTLTALQAEVELLRTAAPPMPENSAEKVLDIRRNVQMETAERRLRECMEELEIAKSEVSRLSGELQGKERALEEARGVAHGVGAELQTEQGVRLRFENERRLWYARFVQ